MKHIGILLTLVAALLFVACRSDNTSIQLLDQAETLMNAAPDTALALLDSIDSQRLGRADNARYALLRSQALDKNFIDITNDSLISIAVDYYKHSHNNLYKGMAYFYLSRIYENGGRYEEAIANSVQAEEALSHTDDYYMQALVLENRGDIYVEQYKFDEAIELKRQAIICYEKCNNKRNTAYTHLRISSLLKLQYPADSVMYHLDMARHIGLELNDEELLYMVENYRASYYDYAKEYDKAITTLRNAAKQYPSHKPNADDYYLLCRIYYNVGKPDSALYYLDNFIVPLAQTYSDYETIYIFKSNIYLQKQDYVNAHQYYRNYTNSMIESGLWAQDSSVKELEKKYRTQQLRQESELLKARNQLHTIVSSLAIGIVILLIYLYRRQRQMSIAQYYQLHESAQKSVAAMQQQYDAIQQQLNRQMSQKQQSDNALLARIDMLKTIIDLSDIYESNKDEFYKRCRSYMNLCNTNKHSFVKDIREIASFYSPNFIAVLQKHFPNLSGEEIDFCCLEILGFEMQHLRILFGHRYIQSTYSKRARLLKKLGLERHENIRDFLLSLS